MGSGHTDTNNDECVKVKRPVERQRMRPWLIDLLNGGKIPGLAWENKDEQTFRIHWKHGSRHGYNAVRDASLFEKYAELTGRRDPKNPNPKKWKANFRCALNSLSDVEEIKAKGVTKGHNAYRVYRFLDGPRQKAKSSGRVDNEAKHNSLKRKRKYKRSDSDAEGDNEDEAQPCSPSSINDEIASSSKAPPPPLPSFEFMKNLSPKDPGVTRHVYPNHLSGCTVVQKDNLRSASAPITFITSPEGPERPSRPSSHNSATTCPLQQQDNSTPVPRKRRRTDPGIQESRDPTMATEKTLPDFSRMSPQDVHNDSDTEDEQTEEEGEHTEDEEEHTEDEDQHTEDEEEHTEDEDQHTEDEEDVDSGAGSDSGGEDDMIYEDSEMRIGREVEVGSSAADGPVYAELRPVHPQVRTPQTFSSLLEMIQSALNSGILSSAGNRSEVGNRPEVSNRPEVGNRPDALINSLLQQKK